MNVYYYDHKAKELRRFVEGTTLNAVIGLRDLAGNLIAFDGDGWLKGVLSDAGSFTPVPETFSPRHISEYGTRYKVQGEKPEMLKPLRAPDDLGSVPVQIETAGHLRCGNGKATLLRFISGRLVLRFDLWPNRTFDDEEKLRFKYRDFEFDSGLLDSLRRCASSGFGFELFKSAPPMGVVGEVRVAPASVADILISFSKHVTS